MALNSTNQHNIEAFKEKLAVALSAKTRAVRKTILETIATTPSYYSGYGIDKTSAMGLVEVVFPSRTVPKT